MYMSYVLYLAHYIFSFPSFQIFVFFNTWPEYIYQKKFYAVFYTQMNFF